MLRFKEFSSPDGASLEEAINRWLAEAKPDVKFMQQSNGARGETMISFVYEEGFQATEQRLTEEATLIVEQALKDRGGAPLLDPVIVDEGQQGP